MEYLLDNKILFKLRKNRRSKRMRITINNNGDNAVSMPFYVSYKFAQNFIEQNREWIYKTLDHKLNHKSNFPELSVKQLKEIEKEIITDIENRLFRFNQHYKLGYKKIRIKRHKTLWGSCTRRGTLNFNYKIHYLPDELKDYLIVHELCHIKEFNHSKSFWNLVGETIPNYQTLRRKLRSFK